MSAMSTLHERLCREDPASWRRAVDAVASAGHPIDRNAALIWFAFYPLELHLALDRSPDPATTARKLGLMGRWRLADQVDTSHRFFFSHRYWPQVKAAVQGCSAPFPDDLTELVTAVADAAARTARVDREFLLGIGAAGLFEVA